MSIIKPFRGVRPNPDLVEKIASPPYDVMNTAEARQLSAGNPFSFLHVIRAEIDFEAGVDEHSDEVYQRGAANLRQFLADGWLIQDAQPNFYLYQVTRGEHVQRGVVANSSVAEYEANLVKKHENTTPVKEDDRTHHINTLGAQTGPVMVAYKDAAEIDAFIDNVCNNRAPVYDLAGPNQTHHTFWVINEPAEVKQLQALFAALPATYIADGHHRSAAAWRVAQQRRAANPNHTGDEAYNYFLTVIFPHRQLQILDYNRLVKDLNGLSVDEFMAKVSKKFDVRETDSPKPSEPYHVGMRLDGKWYELVAKPQLINAKDPIAALDISVLQDNLLTPILGIENPRTDKRIEFVGGVRGMAELERRCATDMRVGFALYPTSIDQLLAVADANKITPPKSTWFEPKLMSGLIIHKLDD